MSNVESIDNEKKSKGITRSVVFPPSLDARIIRLCEVWGYGSISDFVREASRKLARELESEIFNKEIWNRLGLAIKSDLSSEIHNLHIELNEALTELKVVQDKHANIFKELEHANKDMPDQDIDLEDEFNPEF